MTVELVDAAGRRRSPATLPGYLAGRSPRNKGVRYPAAPPSVEEIVAVMRHAGTGVYGARSRALIVVLWRAGLRISEALALAESELDAARGSILVRRGKGGRRREIGMDPWGWEQLRPGWTHELSCRSARCSAWSLDRAAGALGHPPPCAAICADSPRALEYADVSRRISCVTPTPSRWPAKASLST